MPTQDLIFKAAKIIESGGIVIHPTDTCYGLAANALDPQAIKKIYALKVRDFKKPLIICVRDFAMANQLVKFNKLAKLLFEKFLPGPLTLVLPGRIQSGTQAIRIPNNPVTLALSEICSVPYTTTSANFSGGPNPYSVNEIPEEIRSRCDLILNAGFLPHTSPSTIVDASEKKIKILRVGPVSEEQILEVYPERSHAPDGAWQSRRTSVQ